MAYKSTLLFLCQMILKKSGGNRAFFLVPSLCREEVTMKKILQFFVVMMFAAMAPVSVQAQEARYVKVINETGVTVERVYLSLIRIALDGDRIGLVRRCCRAATISGSILPMKACCAGMT